MDVSCKKNEVDVIVSIFFYCAFFVPHGTVLAPQAAK